MDNPPITLVRFVAPPNDRVAAPQAGYVIGLLDVAGYSVKGVLPDDAAQFAKAVKILRITRRDRLVLRQRDPLPPYANEVFVQVGSKEGRPIEARVAALGSGSKDDPVIHDGDPIATGRAILRAARVADGPPPPPIT
jgi:hypothetical protein